MSSWRSLADMLATVAPRDLPAVDEGAWHDEPEARAVFASGGDRAALKSAGVPERILGPLFGGRTPFAPGTPEALVELGRRVYRGESLYLHGPRGCGKSHVAAAGLLGLRRSGRVGWSDMAWAEWTLALHRLREEARGDDAGESYLDHLRTVPVLVLDDVGATARPTPYAVDALSLVVRERYNELRQTVVTSNHAPDGVDAALRAAGYPPEVIEPLVSRIVGAAGGRVGIIALQGADRRTR